MRVSYGNLNDGRSQPFAKPGSHGSRSFFEGSRSLFLQRPVEVLLDPHLTAPLSGRTSFPRWKMMRLRPANMHFVHERPTPALSRLRRQTADDKTPAGDGGSGIRQIIR